MVLFSLILLELMMTSLVTSQPTAEDSNEAGSGVRSCSTVSCMKQLVAHEAAELLGQQLQLPPDALQATQLLYFRQQGPQERRKYYMTLEVEYRCEEERSKPSSCPPGRRQSFFLTLADLGGQLNIGLMRPVDKKEVFKLERQHQPLKISRRSEGIIKEDRFATQKTTVSPPNTNTLNRFEIAQNTDLSVKSKTTMFSNIPYKSDTRNTSKDSDESIISDTSGNVIATEREAVRPTLLPSLVVTSSILALDTSAEEQIKSTSNKVTSSLIENHGNFNQETASRFDPATELTATKSDSIHVSTQPRANSKSSTEREMMEDLAPHCRTRRHVSTKEVHIAVNHPFVQKTLQHFLENQERGESRRLVITDVITAKQKMVTDHSYQFEFVLGISDCLKNSTQPRRSCSASATSPLSNCRVRALQQPGQGMTFNSVSCVSNSATNCGAARQCPPLQLYPHGPVYSKAASRKIKVNIHEDSYTQLLLHVRAELNRRSRSPSLYQLKRTESATIHQPSLSESDDLVDQKLYYLQIDFARTDCLKADVNGTSCLAQFRIRRDTPAISCDIRVSSLPWANRMRVLDMFCEEILQPCAHR